MYLVRVAVSHGYAGPPPAPPHLIPALLPPTTTIIKRRGVWGVVDLGAASPLYRLLVHDTQCGNHQPGQTFSIRSPVGVVKKALSTYHEQQNVFVSNAILYDLNSTKMEQQLEEPMVKCVERWFEG